MPISQLSGGHAEAACHQEASLARLPERGCMSQEHREGAVGLGEGIEGDTGCERPHTCDCAQTHSLGEQLGVWMYGDMVVRTLLQESLP